MARIANAPCSWGVIEGIDGADTGYERVIDEMAETGYAGTELGDWGFMPTDPERLRDELGSRGLALVGSWVSVRLHDRADHEMSAADAVRTAVQLAIVGGPESVVVLGNDPYGDPVRTRDAGRVTPDLSMSDEQWNVFATGANDVARRVMDETGLRTVFHQHIGTLVETADETRRLLETTDASVLGLCLDTGHWTFGTGEDPVAAVAEFAGQDLARPSQGLRPRCRPLVATERHGTGRHRSGTACSASWAAEGSTSQACCVPLIRSDTPGGWSSNRTSCPGRARHVRARAGTGSISARSARDRLDRLRGPVG